MLDLALDFARAHVALTAVTGGGLALLVFGAVFSAITASARVYGGILPMILGGGWLLFWLEQSSLKEIFIALGVCLTFGGATYLVGYLVAFGARMQEKNTAEKEEKYRQVQYTLPDRENSYVRARLQSVLHTENGTERDIRDRASGWKTEFAYARALLARVRAADLTVTDRFETEELGRLLAMYAKKEKLTAADLQTVNDSFALLLKLAAKYAVNP